MRRSDNICKDCVAEHSPYWKLPKYWLSCRLFGIARIRGDFVDVPDKCPYYMLHVVADVIKK